MNTLLNIITLSSTAKTPLQLQGINLTILHDCMCDFVFVVWVGECESRRYGNSILYISKDNSANNVRLDLCAHGPPVQLLMRSIPTVGQRLLVVDIPITENNNSWVIVCILPLVTG